MHMHHLFQHLFSRSEERVTALIEIGRGKIGQEHYRLEFERVIMLVSAAWFFTLQEGDGVN
jgi:hypothetical protein